MIHDQQAAQLQIRIAGEVNLDAAASFRERLQSLMPSSGPVVIDLSELTFMTSTGVGALVEFKRHIEQRGGSLTLENLQPPVRSIFDIAKLNEFFGLPDSGGSGLPQVNS